MRFLFAILLLTACASTPAKKESPDEPPPSSPPQESAGRPRGDGKRELDQAKKLAANNDLDGAIKKLNESIAKNPNNEEAYLLLGSTCSMKEDLACEKEAYERGTAALPRSALLLNEQGLLQLRTGDTENAVRSLERAIELAPKKEPKLMADLAYAYILIKRIDEGEKLAREARAIDPKSFEAAMAHGETLLSKKDGKNAVEAFTAALALTSDAEVKNNLNGRLAVAHAIIAAGHMSANRPKDAVAEMELSVQLAPDDARFLGLLMQAQEKAGDKKGAAATKKRLEALGVK